MAGRISDIFNTVEVAKGDLQEHPSYLMKLGANVLELTRNKTSREENRIHAAPKVVSSSGEYKFPVVFWHRNIGFDVDLSIVDKRKIKAGLLLTASVASFFPEHTVVQAFVVNDSFSPFKGLRRVLNHKVPDDVAPDLIQSWQESEIKEQIEAKASTSVVRDYVKAIKTIQYP